MLNRSVKGFEITVISGYQLEFRHISDDELVELLYIFFDGTSAFLETGHEDLSGMRFSSIDDAITAFEAAYSTY